MLGKVGRKTAALLDSDDPEGAALSDTKESLAPPSVKLTRAYGFRQHVVQAAAYAMLTSKRPGARVTSHLA